MCDDFLLISSSMDFQAEFTVMYAAYKKVQFLTLGNKITGIMMKIDGMYDVMKETFHNSIVIQYI